MGRNAGAKRSSLEKAGRAAVAFIKHRQGKVKEKKAEAEEEEEEEEEDEAAACLFACLNHLLPAHFYFY